jgi:hypothetical protein
MYEEDRVTARKDEIRFAGQVEAVKPIAKAVCVHSLSYCKLGHCIPAANASHISAAVLGT